MTNSILCLILISRVRFPVAPLKNDFPEKQYELQRVEFGTKGNGYAFVYKNDIYYSKGARETKVIRLTDTGSDWIYNGIPDWIYQGNCKSIKYSVSKH